MMFYLQSVVIQTMIILLVLYHYLVPGLLVSKTPTWSYFIVTGPSVFLSRFIVSLIFVCYKSLSHSVLRNPYKPSSFVQKPVSGPKV